MKYLLLLILVKVSQCGFCFISDLYLLKLSSPFALTVYQVHVLKQGIGPVCLFRFRRLPNTLWSTMTQHTICFKSTINLTNKIPLRLHLQRWATPFFLNSTAICLNCCISLMKSIFSFGNKASFCVSLYHLQIEFLGGTR